MRLALFILSCRTRRQQAIGQPKITLLSTVILLLLTSLCWGQRADSTVFYLDSLPERGFVPLDKGWRWHAGDNPDWARADFDDSRWVRIDPTKELTDLPQVRKAGIGWLRLHIQCDSALLHRQTWWFTIRQGVASDLYVDGHLMHRLGIASPNASQVDAVHTRSHPIDLPAPSKSGYVLAVRVAYETNLPYNRFANIGLPFYWVAAQTIEEVRELYVKRNAENRFTYLKAGIFFILAFLHLCFFIFYPPQRANLFFAISCLLFFQHWLIFGQFKNGLITDLSTIMYLGLLRALLFPIGYLFLVKAIYEAYGLRTSSYFRGSAGVCILLMVLYLFNYRTGFFWLEVGSVVVMTLEILRLTLVAIRKNLRGTSIMLTGMALSLTALSMRYIVENTTWFPSLVANNYAFGFEVFGTLCIPLAIAVYLAGEFTYTTKSLGEQLMRVQRLSAQTLAQEQEKQQLLEQQNTLLENKVAQRTAELRQQTVELQEAQTQLLEADSLKTRFFDNITHEFRTPLTLILSPIEQLRRKSQAPDQLQRTLLTVERNARQLLRLTNQLLDLAKLEADSLVLSPKPGDLTRFVDELIQLFRPLADSRQIALTFDSDVSGLHVFDSEKLEQIVYNLVMNALQFTKAGQVSVQLRRGSCVKMIISDTGIGIPPEKIPYIFNRFYQISPPLVETAQPSSLKQKEPYSTYSGTGIGLALVKELTELMGGTIHVQSKVDSPAGAEPATIFTVDLPLPIAENGLRPEEQYPTLISRTIFIPPINNLTRLPVEPSATKTVDSEHEKALVLLVEDNIELLEFLAQTLEDEFRIITALNGLEGWRLIQQEIPDIVISDLMMPEMDGYALCQHIKTDPATDHVAVILLTARTSQDSRLHGLSFGADEYLTKPFHTGELLLRVRNIAGRQQKLRQFYSTQLAAGSKPAHLAGIENEFLHKVFRLLEAHLDNSRFGVDDLAENLAMSRRTLHRKLNALIELPASELIRQYRLKRGAELLRLGHPVAQTAYQVGFESPQYFARVFKAFYNYSPSEYAGLD